MPARANYSARRPRITNAFDATKVGNAAGLIKLVIDKVQSLEGVEGADTHIAVE